jgi:rhamnogalacturonan endolyase
MSKRGENRGARVAAAALLCATALSSAGGSALAAARRMEALDRGLVAVPAVDGGVLVSWRLLGDEPVRTAFNLYRDGVKLNGAPLAGPTDFVDKAGDASATYTVRAVIGGKEAAAGKPAKVWTEGYLSVPIQPPADGVTPAGEAYSYTANDASVGDLDGDGRYEIVLKWDPTNSKDNAFGDYTGDVFLDAYTLEGRRLWRIDLGRNIRAGAHYTQFQVFDYDGDGKAEVAMRTSDGTVDGTGQVLGDPNADWRESGGERPQADKTGATVLPDGSKVARVQGRILKGPEYLTVFNGVTGKALASAPYSPPRDPRTDAPTIEQMTQVWGDGYGNRSDRFLAGTAYLDGRRPSLVFARGYYGRTTLAAWDFGNGKLTQRWLFDSAAPGNERFAGQGNHQFSVADVDGDGRDEIVYGSMAVDDDGKGLWSAQLFHGDAMHVSDLDPSHPGLEKLGGPESPGDALYTAQGKPIEGVKHPRQTNFAIWWDGDDLRELLDKNQISKWDWRTSQAIPLLTAAGVTSNNGTKSTPTLSADILGDWREEVIWRAEDNRSLRIYATPYVTQRRLVTLMHDPQYRVSIAWQNTAYNQPPHTSFYLGEGMKAPPRPDIQIQRGRR